MARKSALGEYVHLKADNYLKYGVARFGGKSDPFDVSERFLNNRLSKVKSVNKSTIDLLKARLTQNATSKILQEKGGVDLRFNEKIDTIWEMLASLTEAGAMGYAIGTSKGASWAYAGGNDDLYRENVKSKALTFDDIEKKRKEYDILQKKISTVNKNGIATEQELQEIIDMFDQLNVDFKATPDEPFESIISRMQSALGDCYINATKQAIVGDFGEHFVALADDYIYNFAADEFIADLKKHVVGRQGSSWSITKENFAPVVQSYMETDEYNNMFKVHTTQDKVDVEMTVNGKTVYGSVKNYYDASKVGLQSDVQLVATLIYLENRKQFGTHWLNMHAGRLRGNDSDRKRADTMLEKEIGYEALVTGNPLKTNNNQANVFIHLNRANGDVQVWGTKDLLLNEFHRLRINPRIDEIILNNKYSKISAEDRIAKLLLDAHQIEISVSLGI